MAEFVNAQHPDVGQARLARTALAHMPGWTEVAATSSAPSAPPAVDAFDPSQHNVRDVLQHLQQADQAEQERVLRLEQQAPSPRTTVLAFDAAS